MLLPAKIAFAAIVWWIAFASTVGDIPYDDGGYTATDGIVLPLEGRQTEI